MKKLLLVFILSVFSTAFAYAANIDYGYNSQGNYVLKSVDGHKVDYGYNEHGDYVPKYIGGQKIEYGYNSHGNYAPKSIGKDRKSVV